MAPLPKGPYIVTIDYVTTIASQPISHTFTANCAAIGSPAVGAPATTVQLATRSGGSVILSDAVQNWWDRFRLSHSVGGTALTGATLWRYDGPIIGDTFIAAIALSPATGANGAAAVAGHETTLTFRTGLGGIMKIESQEDIDTSKAQSPLTVNASGNAWQIMAAYIMSSEGWLCGRGGSWPVAPMKISQTYNEALEKKRFRPI